MRDFDPTHTSGDFSGRAETPTPITRDGLDRVLAESAREHMTEVYGIHWDDLIEDLYRYGALSLIRHLIEEGWASRSVLDVAVRLELVYEDGSWR